MESGMFFRFPEDARWDSDRCCVAFGIGIGEYEGVVRVYRRVFQALLNEGPTPNRCLEAYYLHRTRLERIAEAKNPTPATDRRWQHRDHGPRSPRTGASITSAADYVRVGGSMSRALIVHREAEPHLPVRIRIAVPQNGLGSQLDQMMAWLDANCGPGFWAIAPSGTAGVVNDALAIDFPSDALARAFVNRWCIGVTIG